MQKWQPAYPKLHIQAVLCVILCALIVLVPLWLAHHRIYSLHDAGSVLRTALLPPSPASSRCKVVNASHYQCLPNVFIIGASKAGSTSLVSYLSQVDGLHFVLRHLQPRDHHREVHRFDRPGYPWSLKALELAHEWASCPLVVSPRAPVLHYTPHYLYAPTVPADLHALLPHREHVTVVLLLREPVARTLSSYWFKTSHLFGGADRGSLEDLANVTAMQMQQRRQYEQCMRRELGAGYLMGRVPPDPHGLTPLPSSTSIYSSQHLWAVRPLRVSPAQQTSMQSALSRCFGAAALRSPALGLRHVDKSIYVDQILRWAMYFPRMLIMPSGFLSAHPQQAMEQLLRHLLPAAGSSSNRSADIRSALSKVDFAQRRLVKPNQRAQPVSGELEDKLRAFFQPYDQMLEQILEPIELI